MEKSKDDTSKDSQKQIYDNILKRTLEGHGKEMIPYLLDLEGLRIVGEENIEVLLPPRRMDRVYRSVYQHQHHITHMELEVSPKTKIDVRLLIYHSLLMEKYDLPIRSVLICPFETGMPTSPLREILDGEEELTFHFQRVPLWKFDGRKYLNERAVCMYALLPAMANVTREMHVQALEQMVEWYKDDDDDLHTQLLCFGILLRRANQLPAPDLKEVLDKMQFYDPLIEEDWYIQNLVDKRADERAEKLAEVKAEKLAEVKAEKLAEVKVEKAVREAAIETSQNYLRTVIQARFPELATVIFPQLHLPDQCEKLDVLMVQVVTALDEHAARAILAPFLSA